MKVSRQVDSFFAMVDTVVNEFIEGSPDTSIADIETLFTLYVQNFRSRWRPLSPVKTATLSRKDISSSSSLSSNNRLEAFSK